MFGLHKIKNGYIYTFFKFTAFIRFSKETMTQICCISGSELWE